MVFNCLVMVIRPRDRVPVPKYWVTVIEATPVSMPCFQSRSTPLFRLTVEFAFYTSLPLEVTRDTVASGDDLPELGHAVSREKNQQPPPPRDKTLTYNRSDIRGSLG